MTKSGKDGEPAAGELIDAYIARLDDWRGETLAGLRRTILSADPDIVEDWKWMGSPTWSCDGMIAVGNAHKGKVKLTFAYGAKFADGDPIFTGKDTGATRRSIDIFEGDAVDAEGLKRLVRAAIAYNRANLKKNAPRGGKAKPKKSG